MHFSFSRRNPLLLNGSVDVKGRNGSTNSNSGNAFIDCTLESLAAEDLKNEVRQIEIEIQVRVGFPSFTTVFCLPLSGRDSTEPTAGARVFHEGEGQTAGNERQPGKKSFISGILDVFQCFLDAYIRATI